MEKKRVQLISKMIGTPYGNGDEWIDNWTFNDLLADNAADCLLERLRFFRFYIFRETIQSVRPSGGSPPAGWVVAGMRMGQFMRKWK